MKLERVGQDPIKATIHFLVSLPDGESALVKAEL
eukprot:gene46465-53996_t